MNNGKDEAGNGHERAHEDNGDHEEQEYFEEAMDGNCFANNGSNGAEDDDDEGDALGTRPGFGKVVARMPVPKYASHYKMDHPKRGYAIIFNHEVFDVPQLKTRAGTNADCDNLKRTLEALGFDVSVYKDLVYASIDQHIKQLSDKDHTHRDCIVIAVLSHGDLGIVYAKDMGYKPDTLWCRFTADRCPTLAGKPKIFFLQACQGDNLDPGVHLTETDGLVCNSYQIPTHADFLIVYSTVKGFYSWRNTTRGSWFIQALCKQLAEYAYKYDLVTILTFVSQMVAIDFESNVPDSQIMHQQKQIPCVVSMLTRLIQFPPPAEQASASGYSKFSSNSTSRRKPVR